VKVMLDPNAQDYFRKREIAERAAAERADSEIARRIHQELAQSYAELARGDQLAPASASSTMS
jgi:hypothetical protein